MPCTTAAARTRPTPRAGLKVIGNGAMSEDANVLCGRFLLPAVPQHLLRDHLPGRLLVRSIVQDAGEASEAAPSPDFLADGSRLARLIQLMREEALEQGPGSESMVNRLSGALFGLTLRFASASGEPPRGLLALAQRPRLQPALSAMFDEPGKLGRCLSWRRFATCREPPSPAISTTPSAARPASC